MSSRIDIELTSSREDGTWTWRAAGAKQPKGVLDGGLLPADATTGQQFRADVETSLDGTAVLAVLPPKTKSRQEPERIEILGRSLREDELVTSTLVSRKGGGKGDRRDRGDRPPRGDRPEGRRSGGPGGPGGRDGRPGARQGGDRPPRGDRPQGDRPQGDRPARPRRERPAPEPRPKAKRLKAGRTHRKAAVEALAPEKQVIAEQLLRGGVPGVRQAIEKQNAEAKAAGQPEVKAEPLLAIAEQLLPALRAAEWRDKAEAAVSDLEELDLRDLRSVVVAADAGAKDDETRALATTLREGLAARVEAEQTKWLAEIAENLDEGRVVRALRLSSRPPKAGAPLPADLSARLAEGASASLTADTVTDRWATVLDALSFSPVRLAVAPASKPETPSPELVAVITKLAARVPKVAESFGITPPPETPKGRRPRKRPAGSAPAIPPPPAVPTAASPAADAAPAAAEAATEAPVAEAPADEAGEPVVADATVEAPLVDAGDPVVAETQDADATTEATDAGTDPADQDAPEAD